MLRRNTGGVLQYEFLVVIDVADDTERQCDKQNDPDVMILKICPQHCADEMAVKNKCATHRRRAGFEQMRFRAVFTHGLAELVDAQALDHARPDDEGNYQRR